MGENLEVVWAEFSTLSQAVLLVKPRLQSMQMTTSKIENSAKVLSCYLKFVLAYTQYYGLNGVTQYKIILLYYVIILIAVASLRVLILHHFLKANKLSIFIIKCV